jgi:hypothetical protein
MSRIGLETGATSTWLWTELNKLGLPAICIDARHAKAALKMQINKSDRKDDKHPARSTGGRISKCGDKMLAAISTKQPTYCRQTAPACRVPPHSDSCSAPLFGQIAAELEGWRRQTLALPLTTSEGPSVIPVLNHYKCIGDSPGKHPDTRRMATGSDDDSRDSVHDRCLCIAV